MENSATQPVRLAALPGEFSVCRGTATLDPGGDLWFAARTDQETSLVCRSSRVPPDCQRVQPGWRALRVEGKLDFALTGILSALLAPLASAGVPVFAVSTFNTDYILLPVARFAAGIQALRAAGYPISMPEGEAK